AAHLLGGSGGVVADRQVDVECVGPVAEAQQHFPQDQAVLAAGDRDEDPLVGLEHLELPDRPLHLVPEEFEKMVAAEAGIVAAQVDHGPTPALHALHRPGTPGCRAPAVIGPPAPPAPPAPPEIAGRISISTLSSTIVSGVSRLSPQMTITVSGLIASSSRMLCTLRRPSKCHSFGSGMRMKTLTAVTPAAPRHRPRRGVGLPGPGAPTAGPGQGGRSARRPRPAGRSGAAGRSGG